MSARRVAKRMQANEKAEAMRVAPYSASLTIASALRPAKIVEKLKLNTVGWTMWGPSPSA